MPPSNSVVGPLEIAPLLTCHLTVTAPSERRVLTSTVCDVPYDVGNAAGTKSGTFAPMCEDGWSGVAADLARSSMKGLFFCQTASMSDSRSWKTKPLGFVLPGALVPPTAAPEPPSSSIV